MFNRELFRAKCIEKGFTLTQTAAVLGINPATLSRKMSGESDFSRNEIQLFRRVMQLTTDEVDRIFFADELAFS